MDKALKQRLVGASVIIALAVIVIPMLLSGRPESAAEQSQSMEIPARPDELSFETRRFPVTDAQQESRPGVNTREDSDNPPQPLPALPAANVTATVQQADSTAALHTPVDGSSPPTEVVPPSAQPAASISPAADDQTVHSDQEILTPTSSEDALSPEFQTEPQSEPQSEISGNPPPATTIAPAVQGGDRYVVQVASLSSAENASRLMAQLQKKGFPALLDTVESDVGRLNRVRVGPFAKETDAVAASALINREFEGVSPRVLDLKPDQSAAVTNPADPLVRWVVQMGSFSDSGNAQKLVEQLRRDGMTAYREDITAKSSTIYRVRVGPFLEREEAIRTRQQLSDRLKIDGVVMSAD